MNMRLVVITVIFVSEIMSHNVSWLRPQDQGCEDYQEVYYEVLERCLKEGFVVDKKIHTCYKLHRKGPCNDGDILAFTTGPCLQTECVANKDSEGTPCSDGWFNYKGTCTEAGSQGCAGQFGRRVRPDLYGDVQCVCDQELGFVEFKGECHFEFLQGPCQPGEQLIVDISKTLEPKCVKNTCNNNQGLMLVRLTNVRQNVCYDEDVFVKQFNTSLLTNKEEKELPPVKFSVFKSHCHGPEAEGTGQCLDTAVEPGIGPKDLLLLDLKTKFNLAGSL